MRVASQAPPDEVEALVGLARRRNPKRSQLVVSKVLAKHVPVDPHVVRRHGDRLGDLVREALDGRPPALVLAYAETATGLGHLVADRLGAPVLHSTRRSGGSVLSFEEEHSHATTHRLQPSDPTWLTRPGAVVLVDDELTSGRTLLNTVRALHALEPHPLYVVAVLTDMRPDAAHGHVDEVAADLGTTIRVVSLLQGEVELDAGPPPATDLCPVVEPVETRADEVVVDVWPDGVETGGRHGFVPGRAAYDAAVAGVAAAVAPHLDHLAGPTHVLGTEELMYLPLRLAELLPGDVTLSSTTRSPVVVVDEPGYAVRHGITFAPHDGADDDEPRFAYNLEPGRFGTIVLVLDAATPSDGATDLRRALRGLCSRLVVARVGH